MVSVEAAAPVRLPDGAQITSLELIAEDNAVSDEITIMILRRPFNEGAGGTIASVSTSGNVLRLRTFTDSTISGGLIDNDDNMYYLTPQIASSVATLRCKAAVINFTVNRPLP